jgi:hypothetical protein
MGAQIHLIKNNTGYFICTRSFINDALVYTVKKKAGE